METGFQGKCVKWRAQQHQVLDRLELVIDQFLALGRRLGPIGHDFQRDPAVFEDNAFAVDSKSKGSVVECAKEAWWDWQGGSPREVRHE